MHTHNKRFPLLGEEGSRFSQQLAPILVQRYPLAVSSRMYPRHNVGVFAHLYSERTPAA